MVLGEYAPWSAQGPFLSILERQQVDLLKPVGSASPQTIYPAQALLGFVC
jgi:hypothetical protein